MDASGETRSPLGLPPLERRAFDLGRYRHSREPLFYAGFRIFDAQHAWIFTGFGLGDAYYTVNGGSTWVKSTFNETVGNRYAMDIASSQNIWVAAGAVYGSNNGWVSHTKRTPGNRYTVYNVDFIDASYSFLTGSYGETMHTVNGGASWAAVENAAWGAQMNGVSFINASKGWLAGEHGVILTNDWVTFWNVYLPNLSR